MTEDTPGPGAVAPAERRAALADVRARLASELGTAEAKRVRAFEDGTLYVDSTMSGALLAWLVDSVLLYAVAVAVAIGYGTTSDDPDRAVGAVIIGLALIVVLPFVYGWAFRNGRALGGLLTGTQVVRMKDGSPVGLAKAGWAMLIRTVFLPFLFWAAIDGIGQVRVSIDSAATARLRRSGIARLP
ncbi:RDD family protein [Microbacterium sp. NPDC056052]|uniref:RDD family protein n=1 Tax=Microbacterium sp. NPDC056052 TaxID=3345695 RepID=UPI0035D87B31